MFKWVRRTKTLRVCRAKANAPRKFLRGCAAPNTDAPRKFLRGALRMQNHVSAYMFFACPVPPLRIFSARLFFAQHTRRVFFCAAHPLRNFLGASLFAPFSSSHGAVLKNFLRPHVPRIFSYRGAALKNFFAPMCAYRQGVDRVSTVYRQGIDRVSTGYRQGIDRP
jgi:hypothetical protein